MKKRVLGLILLYIGGISGISDAQNLSDLKQSISGFFVTTERPQDYNAIITWRQSAVELDGTYDAVIFHERATIRSQNRPYNRQIWVLTAEDDSIMMRHYDASNLAEGERPDGLALENFTYMPDLDLPLQYSDGVWKGTIEFVNPDYLSQFVEAAHSARVSLQIDSEGIVYHLAMYNTEGLHIYGPRERGYRLVRRD